VLQLPWYKRAEANFAEVKHGQSTAELNAMVASGPDYDIFGEGLVVTLTAPIYLNNSYEGKPKLMAVAGVEYLYNRFRDLVYDALRTSKFECNHMRSDSLSQRCYLMDDTGFLIMHPDYDSFSTGPSCECPNCTVPEPIFLGLAEPELAQTLLDRQVLVRYEEHDSVSKTDLVGYRVDRSRLPDDGIPMSGTIDGKTQAEYDVVKVLQTNMVLIMMDSWLKSSTSFDCGLLTSTCPDVVLPRTDSYESLDVCDPGIDFYRKNASVLLSGGLATESVATIALVQRTDMCAVPEDDTLAVLIPILVGVGIAAAVGFVCYRFAQLVMDDQ